MATCYDCIHCDACSDAGDSGFSGLKEDVSKCKHFRNKADFVKVVRCKSCKFSSTPKSVSRYDLYCNNYDVWFCRKEQKIVCGTHYCSYGTPKERGGEK